jgi:hypothetical protein
VGQAEFVGQRHRVAGRFHCDVVVEVHVDVEAVGMPPADRAGPRAKCLVAVATGVQLDVAVEADVDEVRGHVVQVRPRARGVGDDERHVVGSEQAGNRRVGEAGVPHLQGMTDRPVVLDGGVWLERHLVVVPSGQLRRLGRAAGEQVEERREPLGVERQPGWELPENRAEFVVECEHPGGEEVRQRRLDAPELLQVRDEAPALDREAEVGRCGVPPASVPLGPLQGVEGAVDLDAVHSPGQVFELTPLRQALGVEDSPPAGVDPARGPDADLGGALGSGRQRSPHSGRSRSSASTIR